VSVAIPTLTTQRLIMRAPQADDFATYRDFFADAQASGPYGGPLDPGAAWRKLAIDIGHWALRGFGMWSLIARAGGAMIGSCGILWPQGWPRHELTWWIAAHARRQGFAKEASRAAVDWAYGAGGFARVETHMNDANEPARRLAEKLGGVVIAREAFPDGITRNVYRLPAPR
jgi:[ribosomal protein S5]-alanine N-acetyltransferase